MNQYQFLSIDGGAQLLDLRRVERRRLAEEPLVREAGDDAVPLLGEMDAVDRRMRMPDDSAKYCREGVKRSTKKTPLACATSAIACV